MKVVVILFFFCLVTVNSSPHGHEYFATLSSDELNNLPRDIAEDALLDVMGLISKYGYVGESHEAQTDDGYLLTVHRIRGRKTEDRKDEDRIPVFLMHGLLSSSADYITNGPGKALAYILADEGYDVWLGNARGNYYSRKHVSLDPDKSKFWRFSWHQIGKFDLPAMIDLALEKTGKQRLHYIGHSQGTTSFFVMGCERREYNEKIITMQALAPVAYMTNARTPLIKYLAKYAQDIQILLSMIGVNEFLPNANLTTIAGNALCNDDSEYQPLCANLLFQLFGYNPDQLNASMIPVYVGHTPAGASSRQFVHYAQLRLSERFNQYDYGSFGNLYAYGSFVPPKYKLKYVTAPVALHYGLNDLLAEPIDVFRLDKEISNSIGLYEVPDKNFNHMDFLMAIDARTLLYDRMISVMKDFE